MNRRHELSENERSQIVGQLRLGETQREVAERFNITQGAVSKIFSKYRNIGNVANLRRSGRRRVTTRREDLAMVNIANRNRQITGNFKFLE